ncbi:APC family permease [Ligilactobacillus equi]|uniref:Amino acid permease n=1 Tax=Ligilactobacillus equi DPC 6820 TaxID=1392007 RepID=V7HYM1_9LACO|nr:amino acid permease [Ligilactobacillus equi]ETA74370.1 amino acid permease [Ligilactobacillus equi DPC 6820]
MLNEKKHYMSWPVIALLDFVTIISFENIFYPYQNQGLSVVISWIFLLFTYVIPYALIATQLGLTFDNQEGGLASWIRRGTNSDLFGYITSWMYWTQTIPYLVDVSNSVIVSLSWIILGNNTLGDKMSTTTFGLLTFAIILAFIIFENVFRDSLEVLSIIGGGAMFAISMLFVFMTGWALTHGAHIATQPFNLAAFKPNFSLHYFSTTGLLIFAMSGAELAAPYIAKMKNPKRDFPKAMWALAIMTAFLTIFGTLAISVFFNANDIPHDFKMNGPYYAFRLLGQQVGLGNSLMYVFAVVQLLFMLAQLAILIDASSRVFASDTAAKYMPSWLTKKNKAGRPVHSYTLTAGISLLLLLLSGTLPDINSIYNWLLNLNGIVSPYKTALVFVAFIAIRMQQDKFHSDYVYIKNKNGALVVGFWCFLFTFVCATMGFIPQDAALGTKAFDHQLMMNFATVGFLIVLGFLLPFLRKLEMKKNK